MSNLDDRDEWTLSGDGHRTLAERAYLALHHGIVSGELRAGQRLRIKELASALAVSDAPIREAIRQLESRGLVEHTPHRGARVAGLSLDDLIQLYEARLLVEPEIIHRAAERFTPEDAARAHAALARHTEAAKSGMPVERWQAHTDFHFALYQPCGSAWLIRIVIPLWESSQRYRLTIPSVNDTNRQRQAAREHRKMLQACTSQDGEAAASILREHLGESADLIAKHLRAQNRHDDKPVARGRTVLRDRAGISSRPFVG